MSKLVFPNAHLIKALPPERFAAQVLEIEKELDDLYPSWRQPARSRMGTAGRGIMGTRGIEDLEVKARCKYLLQRRKYLYDGKDWEVVVQTTTDPSGRVRMFAGPADSKPQFTAESVALAARTPMAGQEHQASLPQIAHRLQVPIERVERAILDAPDGANLYHWCRAKLSKAPEPPKPKTKKRTKKPAKREDAHATTGRDEADPTG